MTSMQGVQLTAPGQDRRRTDLPVPEPGPGEVRLEVTACGICGADVPTCAGDPPMNGLIAPPVTPGHEFGGEAASFVGASHIHVVDGREKPVETIVERFGKGLEQKVVLHPAGRP